MASCVDTGTPSVEVEDLAWRAGSRVRGRGAIVWMNRPSQLNAVDWEMLRGLRRAFSALDEDDAVRAILLTGRGRAFSAGGDLKAYQELQQDPVRFPEFLDEYSTFVSSL